MNLWIYAKVKDSSATFVLRGWVWAWNETEDIIEMPHEYFQTILADPKISTIFVHGEWVWSKDYARDKIDRHWINFF